MRRYVYRRPFDYARQRFLIVSLFPTGAAPPAAAKIYRLFKPAILRAS